MLTIKGNGTVPLTEEDVQTLILVNKVSWVGNEAFDEADLFQADLVERQNNTPKERLYKNNKAHGKSMAFQGEADAEGIAAMIRARRGQ
jgi:hypothetical protein